MAVKRTLYQRKVDVDMLNAVKSIRADVSSASPSSEQSNSTKTNSNRSIRGNPPEDQFASVDLFVKKCRQDIWKLNFNQNIKYSTQRGFDGLCCTPVTLPIETDETRLISYRQYNTHMLYANIL